MSKKLLYLGVFPLLCCLYASDLNISQLEQEILNAKKLPLNERYKVINKIKLKILQLNEIERIKIINNIRKNRVHTNLKQDSIIHHHKEIEKGKK